MQQRVKELDSLSIMKKVFSSDEHAATLKAHQETIQTTLEEIQVGDFIPMIRGPHAEGVSLLLAPNQL